MPDAKKELNRSVREGRIESRYSTKSLEGMGSSSHDLGAELRRLSFKLNCDTFSFEEKVAAVVAVVVVAVVESPQAPEDDSQKRQRCAWEAHELINDPCNKC